MIHLETKAKELLSRVFKLVKSGKPDDISLQQIHKESKELSESDPLNFLHIQAAIYCARKNEKRMRETYKLAFDRFGGDANIYLNYAKSLNILGHSIEALDNTKRAIQISPTWEEAIQFYNYLQDIIEEKMWQSMWEDTEDDYLEFCMNAMKIQDEDSSCEAT